MSTSSPPSSPHSRLADARSRNDELERHLHLAKSEIQFLRNELRDGGVGARGDWIFALRMPQTPVTDSVGSHASTHRDTSSKLASHSEYHHTTVWAMERILLGEREARGRLQIELDYQMAHVGEGAGCRHCWMAPLKRNEVVDGCTQTPHPPPRREGFSQTEAVSGPSEAVVRRLTVPTKHDPADPKHRAECVWCSGKTLQLQGGTFGQVDHANSNPNSNNGSPLQRKPDLLRSPSWRYQRGRSRSGSESGGESPSSPPLGSTYPRPQFAPTASPETSPPTPAHTRHRRTQ